MNFILTPTEDWLTGAVANCKARLTIASPYVTGETLIRAARSLQGVPVKLITSTNLDNFARGASSYRVVCDLAESGVEVSQVAGLHAKVYIVDSTALVTSANATYNGMRRNFECGVELVDSETVNRLAEIAEKGFGGDVEELTVAALRSLEPQVNALKDFYKRAPMPRQIPPDDATPTMPPGSAAVLLETFSGWQRLVLEAVIAIPKTDITRQEVLELCLPVAATQYPNNNNPAEKVSQMLQELRDLGLLEFAERGRYTKLIS